MSEQELLRRLREIRERLIVRGDYGHGWADVVDATTIGEAIEALSPTAVPSAGLIGLLIDAEALLCDERAGKAANELAATIRASLPSPTRDLPPGTVSAQIESASKRWEETPERLKGEPGELCVCGHHANEHRDDGLCYACFTRVFSKAVCVTYRPVKTG